MKRLIWLSCLFIIACKPQVSQINYHQDECVFCRMKISDPNFGAELVTSKGKVYKFDSAECMFRQYLSDPDVEYAYVMVTDYTKPHTLIEAQKATFLVSENLPSPMGGNLSSYESRETASDMLQDKTGKLYSFDEILQVYKDQYQ